VTEKKGVGEQWSGEKKIELTLVIESLRPKRGTGPKKEVLIVAQLYFSEQSGGHSGEVWQFRIFNHL